LASGPKFANLAERWIGASVNILHRRFAVEAIFKPFAGQAHYTF